MFLLVPALANEQTHRPGVIRRVNAAAAGKSRVVLHALFKRRKTLRVEHRLFKHLDQYTG